jgi:hypothetical protein
MPLSFAAIYREAGNRTMPLVPRIIVVDATRDVVPILRGALALLSRQSILIEVPTADAALEELQRAPTDLVVAAYGLPGKINGIEVAARVNREALDTPVIVLAEEHSQPHDDPALQDAHCTVFVRPVAGAFLRGLLAALDGEPDVPDEPDWASESLPEQGALPPINLTDVRGILVTLMRDAGAMGVILANRRGRVLAHEGATGYIDREKLAEIVGPSLAHAVGVSPLVGGNAWSMQYFNGARMDVYTLALGFHYMMCLIFESSNRRALASVMMYGRRAADQLIEIIGEDAYRVRVVEPAAEQLAPEPARSSPATAAARGDKRSRDAAEVEALLGQMEEAAGVEAIPDLDLDRLFSQSVDEGAADNMFDPESLEDMVTSLGGDGTDRLDYDDAVNMGILED